MEQNDNKYAPPVARVADPLPAVTTPRPRQVVTAIWLLWIALIAPFIVRQMVNAGTFYTAEPKHLLQLASIGGSVLVYSILSFAMLNGKNWGRITYLIFASFGWLGILIVLSVSNSFVKIYQGSIVLVINVVVSQLLVISSVVLLFTKPGSEWFRKRND